MCMRSRQHIHTCVRACTRARAQGENYATTKPRWDEWDSELPYNKNRTCVFHGGSLNIFQLGSNTLGRVNEEDAEKVRTARSRGTSHGTPTPLATLCTMHLSCRVVG